MDIFSQQQKTLLKRQAKESKQDLRAFKSKCKKKNKSKSFNNPKSGSSGERAIETYLLSNNLVFIKEYPIPEISVYKLFPLRFDFYLPNEMTVIEFDGRQHFESCKKFDTPSYKS